MPTIGSVTVTAHGPTLFAVTIDGSHGSFLRYALTVSGAVPSWAFSGVDSNLTAHRLNDATQFAGHPKANYVWNLRPKGGYAAPPTDIVATDSLETYSLEMTFAGATKYDLRVTEIDGTGTTVQVIKNVTFESQDATAVWDEVLKVKWT